MSVYQLVPHPSIAIPPIPFATWTGAFNEEELDNIIKIGDNLTLRDATLGNETDIIKDIRHSKTGWISLTPETQFIYDRLGWVARQVNGQFFDFDIWGFSEDLQYTIYNDDDNHYTWHLDQGVNGTAAPRKLSMVLQLSNPNEYEGGELEIHSGSTPTQVKKERGLISVFPSYILHRVTPVTKGTRKTLVVWLTGPRFK